MSNTLGTSFPSYQSRPSPYLAGSGSVNTPGRAQRPDQFRPMEALEELLEELLDGGGSDLSGGNQACRSLGTPGCFPGQASSPSAGCTPGSDVGSLLGNGCAGGAACCCKGDSPPSAAAGTVTQPSEHYSLGSNFSGPTQQSTTFKAGAHGTVDSTTRYTDSSGHWYQDQGSWDPSTGVLTSDETNNSGQRAHVTTSVQNGQIVSNVSGTGNVSQVVESFPSSNNKTITTTQTDGSVSAQQVTGSNGGPWGTYQMDIPDTVVQENSSGPGPSTTTTNLTFPQASTVSTPG